MIVHAHGANQLLGILAGSIREVSRKRPPNHNRSAMGRCHEIRGRWGEGLTAEKMKDCRWLQPTLVGIFEFVEWIPDDHLRHASFIGLREDEDPRSVVRELYLQVSA